MATYILFWNPAISSFKLEEYQKALESEYFHLNWSIKEHEHVMIGDKFVMVRCKKKPVPGQVNQYGKPLWEPCIDDTTGICITGTIMSYAYPGEDWSGRGRETYYVDLDIDYACNPDVETIVSTKELLDEIPEFDWTGGHSGRRLDESFEEKLDKLLNTKIKDRESEFWRPSILL